MHGKHQRNESLDGRLVGSKELLSDSDQIVPFEHSLPKIKWLVSSVLARHFEPTLPAPDGYGDSRRAAQGLTGVEMVALRQSKRCSDALYRV